MTLANYLTFLRIILIPFILIFLFIDTFFSKSFAFLLFFIACLTDYLDGYIAKSFKKTSTLGTILDPIADKLLILLILFALSSIGTIKKYNLIPAFIIVFREVMILSLRNFTEKFDKKLSVIPLAKWKTTFQMISLGLLLSPYPFLSEGTMLLWFSGALTGWSGAIYLYHAFCLYTTPSNPPPKSVKLPLD